MVLFFKIFLKTGQIMVSQSDTIGIELRNLGTIYLNHKGNTGQIRLFVYMTEVTLEYHYRGF